LRADGIARRRAILEAASVVLSRDGRSSFSMRRVAQEVGISLGNLQHYFPTESTLIRALLEEILERSLQQFTKELPPATAPPRRTEDLGRAVDRLLAIQRDPELSRLFFELWAIASRDDEARAAVSAFYRSYREAIEAQLCAWGASQGRSASHRAALIVILLEGSSLYGSRIAGSLSDAGWRAVREQIVALVLRDRRRVPAR
jgi:AcrR family transcriptional regulator